jgi:galactokinase
VKEALFARAAKELGEPSTAAIWVPGRIEFLGKHTDYAGGRSLVFATEQGFAFQARARRAGNGAGGPRVRITDAGSGERVEFDVRPDTRIPAGAWAAYPITVARRLARDFPGFTTGLDLAFASDLPPAAGLSSSSALVVGVFLALDAVNAIRQRDEFRAVCPTLEHLAGYLGAVENGKAFGPFPADQGVGTQGGSQDQTAVLCSREGFVMQYGWDPVERERAIPWPAGHHLVVGVSGVKAAKTREALQAYNRAAATTAELHRRWNAATGRADPTLARALRSAPDALGRMRRILDDTPAADPAEASPIGEAELRARLEQFHTESEELIPAAGDALLRQDIEAFGALVDRSQAGAEMGLHNQIPETIHLQRSARRLGAVAASAFGAGFGGSVWAMVRDREAAAFMAAWEQDYKSAFAERARQARFITTLPGPPAAVIDPA